MELIQQFITEHVGHEVAVMLLSMLPFIEVRGAIPVGVAFGMPTMEAAALSYFGSLVPMPFLIKLIRPVFDLLRHRPLTQTLVAKTERKSKRDWDKIKKYERLALFVFTALPIPGTGVYGASLVAALMNLRLIQAIPTIALGNLIATLLISGISHVIFV
ncbi:small multi-drug export protein [Peptoniphilus equinus]|uniref:Small multi-drug export protein n=1 Tax=Peptoniphilus equinus TaxID=3016343 RepID=A0ABY7QU58_9FIRM|nr:small multi-drug export protein [Peptoniphilus equinus]WBW49703.1 small multi-drug export protein [Peptoniphilus equinus]